ncbi:MAG TPA: COX15/CtaA family protein [Bryobacteraceae bacterium]|nr:COX15/CtaA family protein [Bryobacteraceae bacterium]HPQ16798.1 COX15/CtaA family protein [Bryobacteraceae bacterium]HPU71867.1 COX15/CtaA family protein [Bryobacteraceae bacterium]
MVNIWLHRYAVFVAFCTLLLLVAGGMVTSNAAGLSVPDWPLSYGKLMPPMEGGVFYEHGHRMIATAIGFFTIILAIWIWKSDPRRWMRNLGWAALGAVIVQGVLGGLTVLYLLPKAISVGHACLAELFFSATVAIAVFTSPGWHQGPQVVEDSGWPSMRSLAAAVPVVILGQVALGAGARHQAFSVIPHVVGAMVVAGIVFMAAIPVISQHGSHPALGRSARMLLGITLVQIFLGIAAYLSRIITSEAVKPTPGMVFWTVLHLAVGALTMAAGTAFAIQVFRHVRRTAAEPAAQSATTS